MNQPGHDAPKSAQARTQEVLETANREIFDGKLADVFEVTYAYGVLPGDAPDNLRRFNSTLFTDFAGYGPETPAEELLEGTRAKLETRLATARKLRDELSGNEGAQAALLRGSLGHAADLIECALIGLPYEVEKTGAPCAHDRARRLADVAKLEEIETRAFGGVVRSKPEEAAEAAQLLEEMMKKTKRPLSADERSFLEGVRAKMEDLGGGTRVQAPTVMDEAVREALEKPGFERTAQDRTEVAHFERGRRAAGVPAKEIMDRKIPRENFIKILRLALDIYGIGLPVVEDERSSMYDGPDGLHVPKDADYDQNKLSFVLESVQHEVETHFLTNANSLATLGAFRGGRNLGREEGLAMAFEEIGGGKTVDSMDFRMNPRTLAGEILERPDFEKFLDLYRKMEDEDGRNTARFLRLKRNYPLDVPGAQHKDTTYDRGIKRIMGFIREGGDPRDLFVGKVSFEDMDPALALAREKGVELKFPLFVTEVVRFALAGNKVTHDEFVKYLRAKYPFLGDKLDPAVKLTRQNAAKVKKILRLLGA